MLSVTDYSDAAILIDRTETYVGGFKGVAIVRDRRESPDTIQARELFLANLNINNHPVYPGARRSPLKKTSMRRSGSYSVTSRTTSRSISSYPISDTRSPATGTG